MRVEVDGVEYITRKSANDLTDRLARLAREARAERDGLAATLAAAHRDLGHARDALAGAHARAASCGEMIVSGSDHLDALRAERDGLAATLEAVTRERDDARTELDRRKRQLCKERGELDGCHAKLASAERQLADERRAHELLRGELARETFGRMSWPLPPLPGDYTYMTRDEARRLKERGDALEQANAELVRELAAQREVNRSLRDANKDLVGQNARLTTGNMRLRAARDLEHGAAGEAPPAPRVEIRSETLARMQRRVTAQGARISALRAGLRAIASASADVTREYVANVLSDDDARKNAAG